MYLCVGYVHIRVQVILDSRRGSWITWKLELQGVVRCLMGMLKFEAWSSVKALGEPLQKFLDTYHVSYSNKHQDLFFPIFCIEYRHLFFHCYLLNT